MTLDHKNSLKGIVHPNRKILLSFTHPQVVPNLYDFLCSAEHKARYSEEQAHLQDLFRGYTQKGVGGGMGVQWQTHRQKDNTFIR